MDRATGCSLAILAAGIIAILAVMYSQYSDCSDSAGTFVRGLVWFECIK